MNRILSMLSGLALVSASVIGTSPAAAQTKVDTGFNLFSPEQEVELGREAAKEVEQELPVLRDSTISGFVQELGRRLADHAPGERYPYQFKVLNIADVNAFALPGGFIYVNRGLIEAAENESQLAGVLAHEAAHVALRHSTNQISKSYLAQAGLSVLGGLLGDRKAGDILQAVGGTGLSLLFLKFGREAEQQADTVGAQMMARAGYDPLELARFFEQLEAQSRGGPPEFLSSHPSYANREENIRREAGLLNTARSEPLGGLKSVKARLARMEPARRMEQVAAEGGGSSTNSGGSNRRPAEAGNVEIERPSSRLVEFSQRRGYYRMEYPENWKVYEARDGFGVTIAPEGGVVRTADGRQEIVYGFIVNHYEPFLSGDDRSFGSLGFRNDSDLGAVPDSLEDATRDLLVHVMDGNPHLQPVRESMRRLEVDGRPALSGELSGTSPVTGREEYVTLVAREAGDGHVLYGLMIAPEDDYPALERTFERMLSSLNVNDRAVHSTSE